MQSWPLRRTENFIYCLIPHELANSLAPLFRMGVFMLRRTRGSNSGKQYQTTVVLPLHPLRNRGLLCPFPFRTER
jgi:hypothetical protein